MQIPPLNSLRAFEAAGRLLSLKRASEELCVTPGAISRQITLLETHLGESLFRRGHRQVQLTQAGAAYLLSMSQAFQDIALATGQLLSNRHKRPLHIWCPMTFGMKWLVPRLSRFREKNLERDVVFTTALGQIQTDLSGTDVAVRIGSGNWPDCVSHRLVGIELIPVCSPGYARAHSLMVPNNIVGQQLLQSAARPAYWQAWLNAACVEGVDPNHGMTFESISLAYQMAIEGAGLAMGQHALVASDIDEGKLVTPFNLAIRLSNAFYLVFSARLQDDPFVRIFRDWLLEEASTAEAQRLNFFTKCGIKVVDQNAFRQRPA